MTQAFVALRGNASSSATDLGGGSYQLTLTVVDDSGVYTGVDVAVGQKLLKAGDGGTAGQMKTYTITSVDSAFVGQVTITVSEDNSDGTPGFGNMAIAEPNASGVLPIVSGIDTGLQQAITQYNQTIFDTFAAGDSLYSADGQLAGSRSVDQNGNALDFQDGVQSVAIAAGTVTTTGNIEITGNGNGIIRTAPDGSRFLESTNNLGVTTSTKLP